jgi:alanine-glyoxylate transaminase/serine-glyoxylate transaminase/serine-pyruvate transaminase
MDPSSPLLMIPGPVEISPAVLAAFGGKPPGHLAPGLIEAFGDSLRMMRRVWQAGPDYRPFVVAGGGTVAMEMAAANFVSPGERAIVVNTGYFSTRMADMLRRYGVEVTEVGAPVGDAPSAEDVGRAFESAGAHPARALFATHVDTSTGVRIDPAPLAALARDHGALSLFDGVCATAGERFDMTGWSADVYLTGSQKAIGLPPGLALMVASPAAMEARASRRGAAPPLYVDVEAWEPVMTAYEEGRPAYFSTPATNLVLALRTGLSEILEDGMEARFALHERAGGAMRSAWRVLGLDLVQADEDLAANTLSALRYPDGVDASVVGKIAARGVIVAGGLHPEIRNEYFRVGHMGYAATREDMLLRTVEAVGGALHDAGSDVDPAAAVTAAREALRRT